jgi:uncharacterized membrane protein
VTDQQTPAPKDPSSDAPADDGGSVTVVAGEVVTQQTATVVGAQVADAAGNVQAEAAAVISGNTILLVADFADEAAAQETYEALIDEEIRGAAIIQGVVVAKRDTEGKLHLGKMTDHSTRTGMKWGILGGAALGLLFPPSIIAGAVYTGVLGGVLGKARNLGRRHAMAKDLENAIEPGHSGIIALVEATSVETVKADLKAPTKVTTAEVTPEEAKDIAEVAKAS